MLVIFNIDFSRDIFIVTFSGRLCILRRCVILLGKVGTSLSYFPKDGRARSLIHHPLVDEYLTELIRGNMAMNDRVSPSDRLPVVTKFINSHLHVAIAEVSCSLSRLD